MPTAMNDGAELAKAGISGRLEIYRIRGGPWGIGVRADNSLRVTLFDDNKRASFALR
jgi:hypothetical protein